MLFPLQSIGHSLKINPLNDFVLETLRVQMGGECVGVSFKLLLKSLCVYMMMILTCTAGKLKCLVAIFVLRSSRDES